MRQGERTDIEPCGNLHKVSQTKAAELLNVTRESVLKLSGRVIVHPVGIEARGLMLRGVFFISRGSKWVAS
jgi:hypothetical protein